MNEIEKMREANRARFPDFTAAVDRLKELFGAASVKVIGVVGINGDELGRVDDGMRASARALRGAA